MSYTLIERKELTEAASSIDFISIPQTFSDLVILISARSTVAAGDSAIKLTFNSGGGTYTNRRLNANGATTGSDVQTSGGLAFANIPGAGNTANTFGNIAIYIPNYAGSTAKSFSTDLVSENNSPSTFVQFMLFASLWSETSPINSISFVDWNSANLAAGSSISLYGINRQQAIGAPKALGGQISFANGYWYHSFTTSGSFTPLTNLDVDGLVVAGGGGGSNYFTGGGGAGGVRVFSANGFNPNSSYAVLIGAGGAGAQPSVISGNLSSFSGYSATGGGAGKRWSGAANPNGGSGGGGALNFEAGGTGNVGGYTPPEGFSGGAGGKTGGNEATGGGGGAGGAGVSSSGSGTVGGNGGIGVVWAGSYYGGGGGGGSRSSTPGTGGLGGGGNGGQNANGTSGQAGTGGGAGGSAVENLGSPGTMPNGGSGIVVIRYKA
jgi:hypothetical protein